MTVRPHNLSGEGLADGDYAVHIESGIVSWEAMSASGVQSIVPGTDIDVDDTDPANPIVSYTGSGGGAGSGDFLTPDAADLHATYGDHFESSSLDAKWTRVGYVSGDEQRQMGGGSWMQVDSPRAAANYYYQAAPAGDFTIVLGMTQTYISGSPAMFGPLILDNSGNGAGGVIYSAPDSHATAGMAAGVYDAANFQSVNIPSTHAGQSGAKVWMKLNKTGNLYKSSISLNGQTWRKWTPTITKTITPTRIGFGGVYATVNQFTVDFFDVQ